MIKLLIGLVLVLSAVFLGSNSESQEEIVNKNNYSICLDEDNHNANFDFGGTITSNNNTVEVKLLDDYNIIPSISTTGNIGFELLSSKINQNIFRLLLPEEDGNLTITLSFGEKKILKNLYSSKREVLYGLSSLSLYSAQKSVGNLPRQEFMDNDSINATYVETPDFSSEREEQNRLSSGGTVYGYFRWTDDNNVIHPLIGAKVKLIWNDNLGDSFTYTNSSGYFEFTNVNMLMMSISGCYLHIYAKNEMCEIKDENLDIYEMVEQLIAPLNAENYNYGIYTFSATQDTDLGRAMQIFTAMKNYSDYAKTLNNNNNIAVCNLIYPSEVLIAQYNNNGSIFLPKEKNVYIHSVASSWDTIGHEYGHHLQKNFFFQNYYGKHSVSRNDIYGFFVNNDINNVNNNDIYNAKVQGTGLAFKEAWPTFFAIAAQSTFSADIKTVPTVGDFIYESYNGVEQNLTFTTHPGTQNQVNGESDELIIMCFLYRLWESDNSASWDNISISMQDIWELLDENNPGNLAEFIDDLYNSSLSFSRFALGELLETFKLSASNITVNSSSMSNYDILPSYTWTKNGQDITYKNEIYNYSNNKFDLLFYNGTTDSLIFGKYNITTNTYSLTQDEWNSILTSNCSNYYIVIRSYATLGEETGPYYSNRHYFNIPSQASFELYVLNSRYYEREIAISKGTSWTYTVNFDHSGYKLFQTFGTTDTVMFLYESNGITLVDDSDEEGYVRNSFIYANLSANTNYVLVVRFYNPNLSDITKLSIMSIGGFKNQNATTIGEYEDIWHIYGWSNYTLNSYVTQYESMVVTWTPNSSGNYTISLESEFDNFLYIINPTSSNELINNVDYNDDGASNTTNASLTGYYNSNTTYLIVFCQFIPNHIFDNLGTGDDIVLRINSN